jgi:hypothetical protein
VFERLVLTRILDIEKEARVDIFGKTQHGFRKGRSTVTAAIELQACLAESMDNNHYVAVASLDLSAAFDVINIELLMKRLEKIGIPRDSKLIADGTCGLCGSFRRLFIIHQSRLRNSTGFNTGSSIV